ncbi:hypothetical protein [Corynebacterium auriscanis]|uniref:hypothetical protein n=1 Tax=Corynebacterium auriscanis TaxID=99807 RepID=UPI0022476747|nr:hypothetical protein [Corynebacterium auriscanis]MCX2164202.1 hypothetical protein [Corynebacterium auriscanis]
MAICMGFTPLAAANAGQIPTAQSSRVAQTTPTAVNQAESTPQTQTYGAKGFLIKQALRVVSSLLRNGKVREVVEEARKRHFINGDMARAIESRPNEVADAMDNTLREAGSFEEGIKEKLRVNLEPVVGKQLALGIAEGLMFVFL